MKKKTAALLVVLMLLAAVLTACGSSVNVVGYGVVASDGTVSASVLEVNKQSYSVEVTYRVKISGSDNYWTRTVVLTPGTNNTVDDLINETTTAALAGNRVEVKTLSWKKAA